jgi:dolichol-phosphate mannosyltransferase
VVLVSTLTVVMPVYNEARGIGAVVDDVVTLVLDEHPGSTLVVVDDGSTDGTAEVLAAAAAADPRITIVRNEPNRGHGPSVLRGLAQATTDWILHIDSDGQLDLRELPLLWAATDHSDLVLGIRVTRRDPMHRKVLTRLTSLLVSALTGRRVRDGNTPFKLVRRSLWQHLSPSIPDDTFAPSILLAMGALRSGARVAEVPTTHLPRLHGRSTLDLARLSRVVVRCAAQTIRFRRRPVASFRGDG